MTPEQEQIRIAYDYMSSRNNTTPGAITLTQSPFHHASHLISALICKTNEMWRYQSRFIYPHMTPCAVQENGDTITPLYQDTCGGWWLQREINTGTWILPDIDATLAITNRPELCDDVTNMSAEHIRHGEA